MLKKLFVTTLTLGMVYSCQNAETASDEELNDSIQEEGITAEPENDAPESYEKGGLKIYPKGEIVEFESAALELNAPEDGATISGTQAKFDFTVNDYELGKQTEQARLGLANSDKGQHIHLIIDNNPYSAHYTPSFTKNDLEPGHHYAIAFLSRSYHESVKNDNAYEVWQFTVGSEDEATTQKLDMNKPMLFYSRPKGEYKGEDAKKVLFDFYLHNADLSSDGYSVMTTINDSLKFEFDTWQPYLIEGLPMGENTIKIELVNAQGALVDSPVNSVTRKFTLTE